MDQLSDFISSWLATYCGVARQEGYVIGISGGVDSALTSTLCAKTGLKTLLVSMPIHQQPDQLKRAHQHIAWLTTNFTNVTSIEVDLTDSFETFRSTLPAEVSNHELSMANTRARLRMTTLYAIGQTNACLVAGTGNKIEDFGVGFYTKYGDGGVDVSPIADLMKSGWIPTPLEGIKPTPPLKYCVSRREALSKAFPGVRLVIPAGNYKVRSNDSDYAYRPHSAFAYYTGVQGVEATADSVLVMQPNGSGHDALLYIHPRSTRDTDAFFRDVKYGELWVGRRFTLNEAKDRYQIETRKVTDLKDLLGDGTTTIAIHEQDTEIDKLVTKHDRDAELLTFVSEARLIKDQYEIDELQAACDASELGFQEIVKTMPAAVAHHRGERVIEAAFFSKARAEGNDVGYTTIAASGAHACVLHWIRNDGKVNNGELVLVDAGVEMDSFYTADITRTLPVNGKFSPAQRALYMLVYEAQLAGFAAVKPGATFRSINVAAQRVLAQGLFDMGVLPCSVEESMNPDMGLHRRWTLHGVSHMLGLDVHDCQHAREEAYLDGVLAEGMVLTVEPGLYIQPDDELFPAEYRGIGIRIEDDVVVTKDGCRNLSDALPRHPDEVEAWMAKFK